MLRQGAPVVSRLGSDERRPLEEGEVAAHDAFVRVAQRLRSRRVAARCQTVLVASSVAGEGTSTVARGVALLLARSRAGDVALVDANAHRPSQHRAFGVAQSPGFLDVLEGREAPLGAIRRVGSESLALMSVGTLWGAREPVVSQSALHNLLEGLRSRFDYVVIDAAPVTQSSLTSSLAAEVDGCALVVEAERTRSQVVRVAQETLERAQCPIWGGVLNRRQHHIPAWLYDRV